MGALDAFEDVVLGRAQVRCELGNGGGPAAGLGELRRRSGEGDRISCRRRGTRTAQPLSRKCRLISPTIVGVA